jgi:DNA-binding IclR family transcriptional regulator
MGTDRELSLDVTSEECRRSLVSRTDARLALAVLRDTTGFTASLAALSGTHAIYIHRSFAEDARRREGRENPKVGDAVSLHDTAAGKALLAALKASESRHLISRISLRGQTGVRVTTKQAFNREVKTASRRGFAIAQAETSYAALSIAVPVRPSAPGLVLAIELALPPDHGFVGHHRLIASLCPPLLETAAQVSTRLCPPPPSEPAPPAQSAPRRPRLSRAEQKQRVEEMARLRIEEGLSLRRIGERFGVSHQAVEQALKARERRLRGDAK